MLSLKFQSAPSALPCITQAFKRTVKLVTDALQKVIGSRNRDGYINALLTSRSKLSKFNKKKEYIYNYCSDRQHTGIVRFATVAHPLYSVHV